MKLKRLITENYRQHRDLDISFEGSLLGIVGDNGTGKSHLLDAVQFALCGKVPGQNKSSMLSWGATSGSVTLYFEHVGKDCRITRSVNGSGASLSIDGEATVKGQKQVNARVEEFTGLDYDVSKQAVFVRQSEVDAVLFTQPADRQMAWQRLCGLGDVTKIHARMGAVLNSYPESPDLESRLSDARETLESMQEEREDLHKELESLGEDSRGQEEGLEHAIKTLEECVRARDRALRAEEAYQRHRNHLDDLQAPCEDVQAYQEYVNKLAEHVRSVQLYKDQAAAAAETAAQAAAGKECYWHAEESAKELRQSVERLSPEIEEARNWEADVRVTLQTLRNLVQIDGSSCPTCGQLVQEEAKRIAQERVDELAEQLNERQRQREALWAELQQAQSQLAESHRLMAENSRFKDTACQPPETFQKQAEEAQASLQQATIAYSEASNKMAALLESYQTFSQAKALTDHACKELDDAIDALKKMPCAPDELAAADEKMKELRQKMVDARDKSLKAANTNGRLRQLNSAISSMEGTIHTLEEEKKTQAAYRKTMVTLQKVRDWFHYSNGPKKIINGLLEETCARTNDFLQKFGASFAVEPDWEEVSFRYYYHDEREVPEDLAEAKELSGGEKIILAVAFRFASYCMFASKVGILTLDEPTVYLDATNVENFCSLMERVHEVADSMDLQILISTHELKLIPFFSGVFNLNELASCSDAAEGLR